MAKTFSKVLCAVVIAKGDIILLRNRMFRKASLQLYRSKIKHDSCLEWLFEASGFELLFCGILPR